MVTQKIVDVTDIFARNQESQAKVVVNIGGAGSSKSWSIAQLLILDKLSIEQNKVIGICRKTFPSLRLSAYKLFLDLLKDYGMYKPTCHNKTNNTYQFGTNLVVFFSLDEPEKIKSVEFNYLWMEETNEFTYEDFVILKLRCRRASGDGKRNQMYLSFNPIDGNSWLALKLAQEEDVEWIHSTYKDNPHLDQDNVKVIQNLINEDENYYRVYALGEWGHLEHLIYPDFRIVDFIPTEWAAWGYGLDFGYTSPMALVAVYMCEDGLYWDERIYRAKLTISDFIELISHEARGDIYADAHRPDDIEEILRAGYNIYPANKDVQRGLDICRRKRVHITKNSVNLIKEARGYQRKVDKNGNVLEEPVKFNDHGMDSGRYGSLGLLERFGFPTAAIGRKPAQKYYG